MRIGTNLGVVRESRGAPASQSARWSVAAAIAMTIGLAACQSGSPVGEAIVAGVVPRDGTPAQRARADQATMRAIDDNANRTRREDEHRRRERDYFTDQLARQRFGDRGGDSGGGGGGGGGY